MSLVERIYLFLECLYLVWGQGKKASVRTAVFLNGMMSHILEMDDVHAPSKAHVGAVVVPAAWPVAEYLGSSPMELLEAIVCGFEAYGRIGAATPMC